LRQHIADPAVRESTEVLIPFNGEVADEQERFLRIRKRMVGNYRLNDGMDDTTTRIQSLRFIRDQDIEAIEPVPPAYHLLLSLQDDSSNAMDYILGEAAVSEAMAMLMESKHFQLDPPPNYPYNACRILAQHMGADFMNNNEFLFALCDVSLLSSYPGIMFYRILQNMQLNEFVPEFAEQVIDYGIQFLYSIGWDVWRDYEKSMNGTCYVIRALFNDPVFSETVQWVTYLFQMGFRSRNLNPYFMVQLYREPVAFEGAWNMVVAQFGTPELQNNSPIRFFNPPLELRAIQDQIMPITMFALNEVKQTLFDGKTECGLYDYCRRSTNGLIVDERCIHAPWQRSQDNPTCAYGAIWISFGLHEKTVKTAH
jgi:hypothetical protein